MNKLFEFQQNKINILGTHDSPMFYGSQIARSLGYVNAYDAVNKHIWTVNKISVKEYRLKNPDTETRYLGNINDFTILINEAGVYQLIFSSKLEKAKEFQHFIFSDVLPTIRKTGAYKLPQLQHNQMMIMNETDLHMKIVDYLRKYYPDALFNASLGELQNTSEKRIESYKKGYKSGFQDLVIFEHNTSYNGFTIEFKNPNGKGVISEKQKDMNEKMGDRGYKH